MLFTPALASHCITRLVEAVGSVAVARAANGAAPPVARADFFFDRVAVLAPLAELVLAPAHVVAAVGKRADAVSRAEVHLARILQAVFLLERANAVLSEGAFLDRDLDVVLLLAYAVVAGRHRGLVFLAGGYVLLEDDVNVGDLATSDANVLNAASEKRASFLFGTSGGDLGRDFSGDGVKRPLRDLELAVIDVQPNFSLHPFNLEE